MIYRTGKAGEKGEAIGVKCDLGGPSKGATRGQVGYMQGGDLYQSLAGALR